MSAITLDFENKSPYMDLSNDNFTVQRADTKSGYYEGVRLTEGKTNGKWYWEIEIDKVSSNYTILGICDLNQKMSDGLYYATGFKSIRGIYNTGQTIFNGVDSEYGSCFDTRDVVSMLLDLDSKTLEFWINGKSYGVAFREIENTLWFPCIFLCKEHSMCTINLGKKKFKYKMPTGYKSYDKCTKYLIKQNNNYYSLQSSIYPLGQPKNNKELEQWYKEHGIDDLNALVEKKNIKSVNLKLDKNDIYKTDITIDFNEVTNKIECIDEENKKEIKCNTEEYQLLDLIKKDIGSKFQIGKWEEK